MSEFSDRKSTHAHAHAHKMSLFRLFTNFPGGSSAGKYCLAYEQACELVFEQTRRNPTWETRAESNETGTDIITMDNIRPEIMEKLRTRQFVKSVLDEEDLAEEDLTEQARAEQAKVLQAKIEQARAELAKAERLHAEIMAEKARAEQASAEEAKEV